MVTVGNPGNAPNTRHGSGTLGAVDYVYRIGKYEVTAGQYTEFLNAVAKADPYGLYDPEMADTSRGANIQRTGSSPSYSYTVAADWANRPVNDVNFWNAARFANWLHNGQPVGPEGPGTTEDGAYHDVGSLELFGRNPGAKFFLPTNSEWYKAAYHKNDGPTGNYWDYPTASDTPPINTLPDLGNHANFYDRYGTGNNGYAIGAPYFRTEVGAFASSPSPYGTFDQGGNVDEWIETPAALTYRSVRGGSFFGFYSELYVAPIVTRVYPAALGNFTVGFRVASIPEPVALTISLPCLLAFLLPRLVDAQARSKRRCDSREPRARAIAERSSIPSARQPDPAITLHPQSAPHAIPPLRASRPSVQSAQD